ncbi:MAG: hypothetical protein IJK02_08485 [Clostridia bacterium]|nr:hypothetical protein [Clostridia bacterium]MBR0509304.1 hypothetical protein [Clostridia bacterium]
MLALLCCIFLTQPAAAASTDETFADEELASLFSVVDDETRSLLAQLGLESFSLRSLNDLSVPALLQGLTDLLYNGLRVGLRECLPAFALLPALKIFQDLMPEGRLRVSGGQIGTAALLFAMLAPATSLVDAVTSALAAAKDLMLLLLPVLTGLLAFSGSAAAAAGINGTLFLFSQTVSVVFCEQLPMLAGISVSLAAADALWQEGIAGTLLQLLNRAVKWGVGLAAGLFSAVLTVKGVLTDAADSVLLKGGKLLVGGVPVVGGALSEALGSVGAGLALVRGTAAVLTVPVLLAVGLPAFIRLLAGIILTSLFSAAAGSLGQKSAAVFSKALSELYGVLLAVQMFHSVVFIVALALVVRMRAG